MVGSRFGCDSLHKVSCQRSNGIVVLSSWKEGPRISEQQNTEGSGRGTRMAPSRKRPSIYLFP